jgi:2-oxoisovalerate dehydrogenase E2 component (dihydrolipoyl transacylase)
VLNAVYDARRGGLVPGDGVHLGVAAQGTTGLVVPVVHDAHTKTLRQLSAALDRLFARARQGGLNLTETRGSTFTVNNFGPLGVDGAVPIVNHPEVGILGIGRIATRPWVVDDEVRPRPTARIGLTFDHRACDGATAAEFLRAVVARIEQPESLHPDR